MQIEVSLSYNDWHLAKIQFPDSPQALALFIGTKREAFDNIEAKFNIGYLHSRSARTFNRDAPCTASPEEILEYIAINKLDESIPDERVLEAIAIMQEAIEKGAL